MDRTQYTVVTSNLHIYSLHAESSVLAHKYTFFPRLLHITPTATDKATTKITTPSNPKTTPMAIAASCDSPEEGGGVEGQVVEFSWEEGRKTKGSDISVNT